MAKNSFILYKDITNMVSRLDNERKGILFQTILDYVNGGDVPDDLDIAVDVAFAGIKANLDLNDEKYQKKVENLNNNVESKRNRNEIETKSKRNRNEIESDTVTVTDTDTVIDTDTDSDTEIENETVNCKTPQSPPKGDGRFETFWEAYPRKVGKQAALRAWRKAKVNADLFERIMKSIELAKQSDQWNKNNGQFIPNPATWINQGRWDDEYPVKEHISDFFLAIAEGGG